ncbi:ATP-binding protein [Rhodoferax sp.]|uniref:sensor histidine kinase n=1 Tax=Rhodoferax sp. TaxID=50421 RepID=UPI0026242565|nr:ATP-binding protein [Rhodoferax sp.]MDD2925071.1 ATP-binding protein [Rhodoferax sp.]
MQKTDLIQSSRDSRQIPWQMAIGYVAIFLLLDWVSFIRPLQGLNITPWSPQSALAIALLLWNRHWLWVVWISLLTAELFVRGVPSDWLVVLTSTTALSLIYAAIAHSLKLKLDQSLALATQLDLSWFTAIVVVGSLLSGVIYISAFSVAGLGVSGSTYEAIARYWIGDAVGLLVLLPVLLVLMDSMRRTALIHTLKNGHCWVITVLTCLLLWTVFGTGGNDHFKYFYLLFLPIVWISAKFGVSGAAFISFVTQLGLILAVQSVPNEDLTVFELQVLMMAISLTGLMIGVVVDERTRTQTQLNSSLRLAAAGQMAASLAHELSQPLTALNNYAQACQILVTQANELPVGRRQQLIDVTQRIVNDVDRAGMVIKRLRDFFRTGSTNLQLVNPTHIVHDAIQVHLRRMETLQLRLEAQIQENLPMVRMDPVQISVVLRNLIDNAIDATSLSNAGNQIIIRAHMHNAELLIEVQDNGPGVDMARLPSLFDAGASDKPGGMGIGLSICRAIVEAHGGRLWFESGERSCFCFTLPTVDVDDGEVTNA